MATTRPTSRVATATQAAGEEGAAQASDVKVAFSAPAADHGWLKAVSDNAKAKAEELGLDMTVNDSATTAAEQADQIETLIGEKPDVLVVLPAEGEPLTPVAQKAMDQGIQVINIDREFSEASAFHTVIGGDNYGIGVQAGNFFADQLQCKGNVVEIQGIAGISVTEQRSQGFADQLKKRCQDGIKIVAQQPADFAPDKGLSVMENILQAQNADRRRVHARRRHGRGRRLRDRERRSRRGDVDDGRRRLEGRHGEASRRAASGRRPSSTTRRCRLTPSTWRRCSARARASRASPRRTSRRASFSPPPR